jgi:hypothetical protein
MVSQRYKLTSKTESPAPKHEHLWWRFPEGNHAAERLNSRSG